MFPSVHVLQIWHFFNARVSVCPIWNWQVIFRLTGLSFYMHFNFLLYTQLYMCTNYQSCLLFTCLWQSFTFSIHKFPHMEKCLIFFASENERPLFINHGSPHSKNWISHSCCCCWKYNCVHFFFFYVLHRFLWRVKNVYTYQLFLPPRLLLPWWFLLSHNLLFILRHIYVIRRLHFFHFFPLLLLLIPYYFMCLLCTLRDSHNVTQKCTLYSV